MNGHQVNLLDHWVDSKVWAGSLSFLKTDVPCEDERVFFWFFSRCNWIISKLFTTSSEENAPLHTRFFVCFSSYKKTPFDHWNGILLLLFFLGSCNIRRYQTSKEVTLLEFLVLIPPPGGSWRAWGLPNPPVVLINDCNHRTWVWMACWGKDLWIKKDDLQKMPAASGCPTSNSHLRRFLVSKWLLIQII